jgi:hypothetical protein
LLQCDKNLRIVKEQSAHSLHGLAAGLQAGPSILVRNSS